MVHQIPFRAEDRLKYKYLPLQRKRILIRPKGEKRKTRKSIGTQMMKENTRRKRNR
jgi:hypothetical protein